VRGGGAALAGSVLVALALGFPAASCAQETAVNTLTDAERTAGWRLLFDGRTTDGWRGYMMDRMPDGWQVVDGALTRTARAGDIITNEKFRDFELALDWKVAEGGNSGVFLRAIEGPPLIYQAAPEIQILDDEAHRDGRSELTSAGALYGLYPARDGVVRPAGEWNTSRIVVRGKHVEHWLNGEKLFECEIGSDDWNRRVAASKFAEWPEFAQAAEGHIGLQDHGTFVAYRNIRIRSTVD
jgi:hypothetical protein